MTPAQLTARAFRAIPRLTRHLPPGAQGLALRGLLAGLLDYAECRPCERAASLARAAGFDADRVLVLETSQRRLAEVMGWGQSIGTLSAYLDQLEQLDIVARPGHGIVIIRLLGILRLDPHQGSADRDAVAEGDGWQRGDIDAGPSPYGPRARPAGDQLSITIDQPPITAQSYRGSRSTPPTPPAGGSEDPLQRCWDWSADQWAYRTPRRPNARAGTRRARRRGQSMAAVADWGASSSLDPRDYEQPLFAADGWSRHHG